MKNVTKCTFSAKKRQKILKIYKNGLEIDFFYDIMVVSQEGR